MPCSRLGHGATISEHTHQLTIQSRRSAKKTGPGEALLKGIYSSRTRRSAVRRSELKKRHRGVRWLSSEKTENASCQTRCQTQSNTLFKMDFLERW